MPKEAQATAPRKRRFPPGQKVINGALIDFEPIEDGFPSGLYYYDDENRYCSLYPSIYSIKIDGHGYFPMWDFFLHEYRDNLGLISIHQWNVWAGIASLRNRGYRIKLTSDRRKKVDDGDQEVRALDHYLERDYRLLRDDLDCLEDALLIHRVRRADYRGTPDDIIVHSPFTPKQLYDGGWAETIKKRVDGQVTKANREITRISGRTKEINRNGQPTVPGKNYAYNPRTLDRSHRFTYDRRQISDAFGESTVRFARFALTYFSKNVWTLFRDKQAFDRDYRDMLATELNLYDIRKNSQREKCYIAANKFRMIYCPSMDELCSV